MRKKTVWSLRPPGWATLGLDGSWVIRAATHVPVDPFGWFTRELWGYWDEEY